MKTLAQIVLTIALILAISEASAQDYYQQFQNEAYQQQQLNQQFQQNEIARQQLRQQQNEQFEAQQRRIYNGGY